MGASYGTTVSALFTMFTVVQFFFGVGVGGEYPVASTSANERAEATRTLHERRGETVMCVFSMQGWGNLMNTLVLAILLAVTGQVNGSTVGQNGLEFNILAIVWRLVYFIGAIPLIFIVGWRIFVLKESDVWIGKRKALKDLGPTENSAIRRKYGLFLYHYWHRSFATAMSWFVWDFAFYGNKLFQSVFIKIINPSAGLYEATWWTFLNNFVALFGYYFAAFTVDKRWMGRRTLQAMGFLWMFVLFGACAIWYYQLMTPANIHVFQFLYYFSSFWGQFGPNATTWLLPAELAPTEMRSLSHGFSAAVGKAGALVAGVVFGLVNHQAKFIISSVCGIAGAILTIFMIGDLTGLDLREGDKRWLAILDNRPYTGEAVNPSHLSLFERLIGYGRAYNSSASGDGDFHTQAVEVGGLVVGTKTEAGAGPDSHIEAQGSLGKNISFQAKSLQYM
jgi:MFS family permease